MSQSYCLSLSISKCKCHSYDQLMSMSFPVISDYWIKIFFYPFSFFLHKNCTHKECKFLAYEIFYSLIAHEKHN